MLKQEIKAQIIVMLKNNAPLLWCISKINNTFIDNAEDLDIVISMYDFLEYSDSYSMTSESLQNYFRDEVNDDENEMIILIIG